MIVQHMIERRVRYQAAIPPPLAVDLDGRQSRRQRARCHDVAGIKPFAGCAKIAEIASFNVHGANSQPHCATVEQVPVDQFIQRVPQLRRVVQRCLARPPRRHPREARLEKSRCAGQGRCCCRPLMAQCIGPRADQVTAARNGVAAKPRQRRATGHPLPEAGQTLAAALRRIAGNDRAIDGTD